MATLSAEARTFVAPGVETRHRASRSSVGLAAVLLAPTLVFLLIFTYWPLVGLGFRLVPALHADRGPGRVGRSAELPGSLARRALPPGAGQHGLVRADRRPARRAARPRRRAGGRREPPAAAPGADADLPPGPAADGRHRRHVAVPPEPRLGPRRHPHHAADRARAGTAGRSRHRPGHGRPRRRLQELRPLHAVLPGRPPGHPPGPPGRRPRRGRLGVAGLPPRDVAAPRAHHLLRRA